MQNKGEDIAGTTEESAEQEIDKTGADGSDATFSWNFEISVAIPGSAADDLEMKWTQNPSEMSESLLELAKGDLAAMRIRHENSLRSRIVRLPLVMSGP